MKYNISRIVFLALFTFSALALAQTESNETKTIYLPGGEQVLQKMALPASQNSSGVVIFSAREALSRKEKTQLKENGVSLVLYLGNDTWWARKSETSKTISPQPFAVYKPEAGLKMTAAAGELLKKSRGNEVELMVSFMSDLEKSKIRDILNDFLPQAEKTQMLYDNRVQLTLSADKVNSLLQCEEVICVEPGNRKRRTFNKKAAALSHTDTARTNYNVDGDGIVVGVWDGGKIYAHKEFKGRLVIANNSAVDEHATHVGGTIGAFGIRKTAKGMAPGAKIISYDFDGDIQSEMTNSIGKYGVLLSNNSYGYPNGWEWEGEWVWYGDDYFGRYSSESRALDKVVYNDDLIIIFAAGNDREDTGPNGGRAHKKPENEFIGNAVRKRDGPYLCVGEEASAKNVIAVGALTDKGKMSAYSSWGPTLDGRIKPEITANGNGVLSTLPGNSYGRYSGTSMASPAVTGSLTIVADYWQKINNGRITPDVMRALVAIAAKDTGRPGPDYSYGFGILDTEKMLEVIEEDGNRARIYTGVINGNNDSKTFNFTVNNSSSSLKAVLAWIDPPAAANAKNPLVNDLDLLGKSPSNSKLYPWTLDKDSPEKNAVRAVNEVDNLELLETNSPQQGNWSFTVSVGNSSLQGSQKFVLIIFEE